MAISERIRERFRGRRAATDGEPAAGYHADDAATTRSGSRLGAFRRRFGGSSDRDGGVGAAALSGVRRFLRFVAAVIRAVTGLITIVIVIAIVFKITDANRDNSIVDFFFDLGDKLVGPFDGMFNADNRKSEVAINWGIAALVWFFAGHVVARLVAGRRP